MEENIKNQIVALFEKHRAKPGAPYEDDHFLDFLLEKPKTKRAVYNSFRGLRRFNAFLDDVQYEFAVCLSLQDREANYSLSRFVARVEELQKSCRGSLKSLDNQIKAGPGWRVLVVADLVLLALAVFLKNNPIILTAIIALAGSLNVWFCCFAWREKSYLVRLRNRIEKANERT